MVHKQPTPDNTPPPPGMDAADFGIVPPPDDPAARSEARRADHEYYEEEFNLTGIPEAGDKARMVAGARLARKAIAKTKEAGE